VTNAGRGSNLTEEGLVENDASVMAGDGAFGAVGAAPGALHVLPLSATPALCGTAASRLLAQDCALPLASVLLSTTQSAWAFWFHVVHIAALRPEHSWCPPLHRPLAAQQPDQLLARLAQRGCRRGAARRGESCAAAARPRAPDDACGRRRPALGTLAALARRRVRQRRGAGASPPAQPSSHGSLCCKLVSVSVSRGTLPELLVTDGLRNFSII